MSVSRIIVDEADNSLRVTDERPNTLTVHALDTDLLSLCLLRVRKDLKRESSAEESDGEGVEPVPAHEPDGRRPHDRSDREADERLDECLREEGGEGGLGPERRGDLFLFEVELVSHGTKEQKKQDRC
jgi:hypothetical protein